MNFLNKRINTAELMDDPRVSFIEMEQTLQQLAQLNSLTLAYRPTLEALHFFSRKYFKKNGLIKILDIGCGSGDTLRHIYRWAQMRQVRVELTGVDLNPNTTSIALKATPEEMKIKFITQNIFELAQNENYHVIINSLMTHHLTNVQIIALLKWMSAHAKYGWFVNDLHRHWLFFYLTRYFVKVAAFNRLIQNDAPLSIARSFTQADWESLSAQAGLMKPKLKIAWHFLFRYGVRYETFPNSL